jgi:hypothetical protein
MKITIEIYIVVNILALNIKKRFHFCESWYILRSYDKISTFVEKTENICYNLVCLRI